MVFYLIYHENHKFFMGKKTIIIKKNKLIDLALNSCKILSQDTLKIFLLKSYQLQKKYLKLKYILLEQIKCFRLQKNFKIFKHKLIKNVKKQKS